MSNSFTNQELVVYGLLLVGGVTYFTMNNQLTIMNVVGLAATVAFVALMKPILTIRR